MPSMPNGINLLYDQIEPKGRWDRIYDWVVGTAKYIVILVELVIIIAFGIRFVMDDKNAEIEDNIKEQQALLKERRHDEQQINLIARTLTDVEKLYEEDRFMKGYDNVISLIPNSVRIDRISVSLQGCSIVGTAPSHHQAQTVEGNFDDSDLVKVENFKIDQRGDGTVDFSTTFHVAEFRKTDR